MTETNNAYEIRVYGHLGNSWLDRFEGIVLANEADGEAVVTVPAGDQALLHGILARIRDLNLELISVHRRQSRLPKGEENQL